MVHFLMPGRLLNRPLFTYYFLKNFFALFCHPKSLLVFFLNNFGVVNSVAQKSYPNFPFYASKFAAKFGSVDADEVAMARDQAKQMFYLGYDNYMKYLYVLAFRIFDKKNFLVLILPKT